MGTILGGKKSRAGTKIVAVVALAGGLVSLGRHFDTEEVLRNSIVWISNQGIWGAGIFGLVYILATIAFLPGLILTLSAGFLFGVVGGTAIVSSASTLGAGAAFLIGRHAARGWIARKIDGNPRFAQVDEAVAREGWRIVALVRLSPLFPFNLLNYAFGLTRIRFRDYLLASWIGMLPATLLYVYLGSLAGDLASLRSGYQTRSPAEWALYGMGLAATLAVSLTLTRIAQKALRERGA